MVSAALPVRTPVETWLESWLDATIDLMDESGASIPSQITIKLSLVSDLVDDNFETFIESVDTDVSRIDGTVASARLSMQPRTFVPCFPFIYAGSKKKSQGRTIISEPYYIYPTVYNVFLIYHIISWLFKLQFQFTFGPYYWCVYIAPKYLWHQWEIQAQQTREPRKQIIRSDACN